MFHHDLVKDTKFLTQERWKMFAHVFEEGGMEVYAMHIHEFVLKTSHLVRVTFSLPPTWLFRRLKR